jgi:hypothetical protein
VKIQRKGAKAQGALLLLFRRDVRENKKQNYDQQQERDDHYQPIVLPVWNCGAHLSEERLVFAFKSPRLRGCTIDSGCLRQLMGVGGQGFL